MLLRCLRPGWAALLATVLITAVTDPVVFTIADPPSWA
jgi:hypothetical protein